MSKLRVAMAGCGVIARQHLEGYKRSGRAVVEALIDTKEENSASFAKEVGGSPKIFDDLNKALEWGEFDAVDIMTPHDLHFDHALACMKANKHILLEKPMAINRRDCEKLLTAGQDHVTQNKKVFMIGENAQYWPEVVKVKEIIDSGRIGDVYFAKTSYWETSISSPFQKRVDSSEHWEFNPSRVGGGILMSGSCHWIRPLRMWLGEVDEVVGTISEGAFEGMPAGFETQAQALLRFKNGKTACFHGLVASHALSDTPFFQVYGSKGEITIGGGFKAGVTVYDREHVNGESQGPALGYMESFPPEIEAFVGAALDSKPLDADAMYCSGEPRIVWAIYRSLQSKQWEKVWDS
ncbi:glucose--fructose oxidoreductase-like isoform X3 [Sycon ciliatum]|uniref:glucose--fructose oxidoreductase-like isoform X3 n=1 Tax=Sycon ciliatum TaxID=27933 RepID=UPI0020ACEDE6|eukprot:scpid57614/ scgid24402/ Glucose--fructose oxidoreductase